MSSSQPFESGRPIPAEREKGAPARRTAKLAAMEMDMSMSGATVLSSGGDPSTFPIWRTLDRIDRQLAAEGLSEEDRGKLMEEKTEAETEADRRIAILETAARTALRQVAEQYDTVAAYRKLFDEMLKDEDIDADEHLQLNKRADELEAGVKVSEEKTLKRLEELELYKK